MFVLVFCFLFFVSERIGIVLCSWFKEIGTNTLTGWNGTELLTLTVWVGFPLNDCSTGMGSGTPIIIFSPCMSCATWQDCTHSVVVFMVEVCTITHINSHVPLTGHLLKPFFFFPIVELTLPSYVQLLCPTCLPPPPREGKLFALPRAVASFLEVDCAT